MLAVFTILLAVPGRADDITVPIALQVDLLGRVVRFERNYIAHARDPAVVVVVEKRDTTASARAAAQVVAAVSQSANLGGRKTSATIHTFTTAAALRAAAAAAAMVYLMPGFGRSEVNAIAAAFAGSKVLTIGTSAGDVDHGMALGFELESSKPRIVVNLPQARAQGLDFSAQLLRLARVVQ